MVGLEDSGNPLGLSKQSMYESVSILCLIA